MEEIANFILRAAKLIKNEEVNKALELLIEAYENNKKILVVGAGRSGLVGKAFAMRLMHLGFNVYVLGETITPSVRSGDILVAISGSGSTELILTAARIAKNVGARVIALTSYPDSPLGRLADHVVRIPGRTKIAEERDYFARQILGIHEPLAPLGTLFENTAMAFLDGMISELMKILGKSEDDLRRRHANVELP
ncbi:MAG: 6-phospho-3-hexuloisomerase [Thermoprotei archaeon]|nr:MAG: 6-phospho-3-hexuloisomerase [Thermoprotei archaeon]RLF01660.1 MAG: 6-phospho-3-hexuloisomerase [Thermoprotei archaeon]